MADAWRRPIAARPRAWVLGSAHTSADRSIAWGDPFPNFSDPDILVVDLTTLTVPVLAGMDGQKLAEARQSIRDKYYSRGIVVVITQPNFSVTKEGSARTNYGMLPIELQTKKVPTGGAIMWGRHEIFRAYKPHVENFSFHIESHEPRLTRPPFAMMKNFEFFIPPGLEIQDRSQHFLGGMLTVSEWDDTGLRISVAEMGQLVLLPPPTGPVCDAIGSILSVYGSAPTAGLPVLGRAEGQSAPYGSRPGEQATQRKRPAGPPVTRDEAPASRRSPRPDENAALRDGAGALPAVGGVDTDAFLSYDHEAKDSVARPLVEGLGKRDVTVWWDSTAMRISDALRQKIKEGLAGARYGIVAVSCGYLDSDWGKTELGAMFGRDMPIFPVLYGVSPEDAQKRLPPISGTVMRSWDDSPESVMDEIADAIKEGRGGRAGQGNPGAPALGGPPQERGSPAMADMAQAPAEARSGAGGASGPLPPLSLPAPRPRVGGGAEPSPYSTGGGGYEYERAVGATYLAAMVCGDAVPGVDGTVAEVRFQQRAAGHILDDLVVVFDKGGNTHRLSLQVKHGLSVGASRAFRDVIADCWQMFTGRDGAAFDPSLDRLGIVVPHVTGDAQRHLLPVLEMARDSVDGAAFRDRMARGDHSRRRSEFLDAIKSAIANSGGPDVSDDDLWRFLQALHIVVLDMDGPDAAGSTLVGGICLRALEKPGEGGGDRLFDALRAVAANLAPKGESIGATALKGRLSSFGLRGHAKTGEDAKHLGEHSRTVMDGIKKTIAGKIALGRTPLMEELEETTKANAITVVHGKPFAGKSALVRMLAEGAGPGAVMFFGAENLGSCGSAEAFLSSLDVHCTMDDMLETCGAAPHRYVIIDGLDRVSYEPEKAQVAKGLLVAVSRYNARASASATGDTAWKIIVTTRNAHLKDVTKTVVDWCGGGGQPATLEVGPLLGEEIGEVRRQAPLLGSTATERLGSLLSLPGYLDMVTTWDLSFPEGASGTVGEGLLFDRFWNEAVLRRGGMRDGRGHGRTREKLLMDMAARACEGRPPADLHDLDQDAVDGLLSDELARMVGNHLVAAHDVIEDYALARAIDGDGSLRPLLERGSDSRRLARPLRICAAKMLEADGSPARWESLLEDCRGLENGEVWARECLLGIADSDAARSNLDAAAAALLRDGGSLLARLLAALPSALSRDNPRWDQVVGEQGAAYPGMHAAYHRLPRDERFSPVLSFALDNMESLDGAAAAGFIKAAAEWARSGEDGRLKRRIAKHAAQRMSWLDDDEAILGQNLGESDDTRALIAAIVLYSSDSAPDLAKNLISSTPSIARNEHFKRGLIEKHGWVHLCKFLPEVAVDVISNTMCTGSVAPGLRGVPGTCDDGWTDLASPTEGPFYRLLSFHSGHGLELVHRLLNHATEQWRRAQEAGDPMHPPRTPLPQTVLLESGPVEVYGDEHAFAWRGHTRRAPDLVASALMALELWLDMRIGRDNEPPAALFDRVLQDTKSAAVVGACCAVALKHKDRSAAAVLPILANPAFWIMDAKRLEADIEAEPIIHMQATYLAKEWIMKEKYRLVMGRAAEPHRADHLSVFVQRLLFGGPDPARKKMQDAVESFPNHVPVFFKEEADDEQTMKTRKRHCQLWSKQADKANYKCSAASENCVEIAFDGDRFLSGDEKRAEEQGRICQKILDFLMWSYTLIDKNKIGPNFTIESALEYAEQIAEGGFASSLPRYYADMAVDARANLFGALVVNRWDAAVEMGVADACLKSLEEMASAFDPQIRNEQTYQCGADRAVARSLPHCYLRGGRRRGAKKAILKFAGAYNPEVLGFLMRALCALWDREDKLALECVERVRRRCLNRKDPLGRLYTDWEGYAAALPALHDVPPLSGGAERRLGRIVDGMLDDTIAAFKKFEADRDYGGAYPTFHDDWCPSFFRALESYAAGRPEFRDDTLARIISQWEAAPRLLENYMRWTLLWGMEAGRREDLLAAWKKLLPAVIRPNFVTGHYRDRRVKKSILALLVFADPHGASNSAKRSSMLVGFEDEASSWCEALVGNKDAIEVIASLLVSAPSALLLAHGIGWIWTMLQPAVRNGLSSNTIRLLSQVLYKASTCERPACGLPNLYDKYAWLVDYLVALNDPVAESLKDAGKNPYEGARAPRRR